MSADATQLECHLYYRNCVIWGQRAVRRAFLAPHYEANQSGYPADQELGYLLGRCVYVHALCENLPRNMALP